MCPTPPKKCPKCKGTRFYQYDDNHGKICEVCCTHAGTPWRSYGKWWCKAGCGAERPEPTHKGPASAEPLHAAQPAEADIDWTYMNDPKKEIAKWLRTTLQSFEATIRADEAEKCNEHIEDAIRVERDENYREMNKQMAEQYETGYRKGLVENCIAMDKQLLNDLKAAKVGEPLDDLIKDIKEKAIAEERASKKTLIECPHVESQGICQKCIEFLRAQERTRIIGLVEKMKKEGCGCTRKSQLNSGCPGWTQEDAALVNDALSRIIEILKGR